MSVSQTVENSGGLTILDLILGKEWTRFDEKSSTFCCFALCYMFRRYLGVFMRFYSISKYHQKSTYELTNYPVCPAIIH